MRSMAAMQSFQDVISAWGTVAAFAEALSVKERTAMSWWQRDSIPSGWFKSVVVAARAQSDPRFAVISHELLADLAEQRRLVGRKAA